MQEIWLTTKDRKNFLRFPYINDEDVDYNSPLTTSTFENSNGKVLTLIGEEGLKTISIKSFFPHKLYRWLPYNVILAQEALNFISENRKKDLILTIVSPEITIIMSCIIKDFTYKRKRNHDISFNLTLEEYKDK